MKLILSGIAAVFAGLVGITVLFGSWYTIDEGERGVLLSNGSFTSVEGPGLHFKLPWFQSIHKISTRQNTLEWVGDSALLSYSSDQQTAGIGLTVTYHVNPGDVQKIYQSYGDVQTLLEKTLYQSVPDNLKTVFGQYTAVKVIQNRTQFNADVATAILAGVKGPIVVDAINVKNIDFSDAYEQTIEARMMAEVEVQKQAQVLAQEKIKADVAVTQANGRAQSVKAEADASAYSKKIQGEAEAAAVRAKGDALRDNPQLVELIQAERWNGVLPTTMLPSGGVPMINVSP